MREPVPGLRLGHAVADFLADLAHANRAAATIRAYRTDLASFTAYHRGPPESITPDVLRGYFATLAHLAPATRARHEATLASLLRWAYRQELITANPMDKLDRVRLPAPAPRGLPAGQVAAILAVIPRHRLRDRVLFGLIAETGLRAGEALGVYLEDLDMTPGDEHLRVLGKGGRTRTVLLDDDRLVATLRRYLTATGYRSGPLFRAEKTTSEARCVTPPPRPAGPSTATPREWPRRCTSCGIPTPPPWSTVGWVWPPSVNASDTPTCKPCSATPNNPTRSPTPSCAPGAAETDHDPASRAGRGDLRDRVRLPAPASRGLGTGQVAAILVSLPRTGTPRRRPRTQATGAAAIWSAWRGGRGDERRAASARGGHRPRGGGGRWPLRHQPRGEGSGVQGDGQQSWPHPAPRLRVAGTPSLI